MREWFWLYYKSLYNGLEDDILSVKRGDFEMDKISLEKINSFSGKYNESMFWSGLQKICSTVGKEVVYKVLQLYYVLQKDSVPTSQKVLIMGALAYLVSPVDVVPDCIPVVGWLDDVAAIGVVLSQISKYVDREINDKVEDKIEELFA